MEKVKSSSNVLEIKKLEDIRWNENIEVIWLKRRVGRKVFALILEVFPNLKEVIVCEGIYRNVPKKYWDILSEFVNIVVKKCRKGRKAKEGWEEIAKLKKKPEKIAKSTFYYWKKKLRKKMKRATKD